MPCLKEHRKENTDTKTKMRDVQLAVGGFGLGQVHGHLRLPRPRSRHPAQNKMPPFRRPLPTPYNGSLNVACFTVSARSNKTKQKGSCHLKMCAQKSSCEQHLS